MGDSEKRKHGRLSREADVTIKPLTFPLTDAAPVKVEMEDVSEGGVGLRSPCAYDEGQTLEVVMSLPGWYRHTHTISRYREDKPLTAVAVVKRCVSSDEGGFSLGLEFTDIWEDHWKAMRDYLSEESG